MMQHGPSLRSDMAFLNDIKVYYELGEIIRNTGHASCGVTFEVSLVNCGVVGLVQQRGEIRTSSCYNRGSKAYFGMHFSVRRLQSVLFNPLNAELNPICYLLALLGVHHFLHVSRIRVKSLTLRLLMSYIYIYIYIYIYTWSTYS